MGIMTFGNGIYFFDLLDQCAVSGLCLIFLAISQCLAVRAYGSDKLYRHILEMCDRSQPSIIFSCFFVFCWNYLTPLVCAIVFVSKFIKNSAFSYYEYVYPLGAQVLGWFLILSSCICPLIG